MSTQTALAPPPVAASADTLYGRVALGPVVPTKAYHGWNGSAVFKLPAPHAADVLFDVIGDDRENAIDLLKALDAWVHAYLRGLDRRPYEPDDDHDRPPLAGAVLVGFGPGMLRAGDGSHRFGIASEAQPRRLSPLCLTDDDPEAVAPGQADAVVSLEATNRSFLLEGVAQLLDVLRSRDSVRLRSWVEKVVRPDGRDSLGFAAGYGNPDYETIPALEDVVLCDRTDEPPQLSGGTYMVRREYGLDLDVWDRLSTAARERYVGRVRDDGTPLAPLPADSLHAKVTAHDAPRLLVREGSAMRREPPFSTVVEYFQRRPAAGFERLHERKFVGRQGGYALSLLRDGVWRPGPTGVYFLPKGLFAAYPGQQLFEPAPFAALQHGLEQLAAARYGDALASFAGVAASSTDLVWPHLLRAECQFDLGDLDAAESAIDDAATVSPEHFAVAASRAWLLLSRGEPRQAARVCRTALRAATEDTWRSFIYHDLALALYQDGDAGGAEVAIRRCVARVNIVVRHCYTLGLVLEAVGKDEEAQKIYDRTIEVAVWLLRRGQTSRRDARMLFDVRPLPAPTDSARRTKDALQAALQER